MLLVGENIYWYNHFGKLSEKCLLKLTSYIPYDPSPSSTLRYITNRIVHTFDKRHAQEYLALLVLLV